MLGEDWVNTLVIRYFGPIEAPAGNKLEGVSGIVFPVEVVCLEGKMVSWDCSALSTRLLWGLLGCFVIARLGGWGGGVGWGEEAGLLG